MKKQVMTGRINRNRIIEALVRQYPDSITKKQLTSQMGMSDDGVGLHLKQLEKDGYVIKEWGASEAGAGRCLHWRLRSLDIKTLETKEEETEIKTMTKEEWVLEGEKLFGLDMFDWKFVCPSCGHVQSVRDFETYKNDGTTPSTAYFNCIGRYSGFMHVSIGTKPGPCNYTSGGLFNLNTIIVIDDGVGHSVFDFYRGSSDK